ncbi:Gastrula zinc finger protein [Echinococcus granulosus]|uniref:Gastrula zinc finger protein n=1 Tax=Echinococcus granulosus TaxID=6210 RepID=W6TZ62_ECHGR|nr:Gastrula zinc finger protein [Echinococcus granulosus]EUB54080.1 Gastrula zinc finger protein [Echinococcus granulosus]
MRVKERPFTCENRGESFMQRCNLNTHISAAHERREPFTCQMCSKAFSSRAGLNAQISTLHKSEFTNSSTIFPVDFWYERRCVNVDPFGVPATIATAVVADFAMAKDVVADPISVGTASPNVASNCKETETSAAYFIGQLVDIAGIDSDLLCNEYLAHGTGVGTASPNVASIYKEPKTSAAYFIGQLVDFAGIDSDLLCNEYLAHGTGQI